MPFLWEFPPGKCIIPHSTYGSRYDPILAVDEAAGAHRSLGALKSLDELRAFIVPYMHSAVVKRYEQPWLRRVQVCALYAVTP